MKKIVFALTAFCSISLCLAQTSGQMALNSSGGGGAMSGAASQINYLLGPVSERGSKTGEGEFGIQGSAYVSEKFIPAKLFYGEDFEGNIYYRYNAYNEEIEIKTINFPGADIRTINRDKKISVKPNGGNPIVFKTFIDKKQLTQNGYLTLLREGKYSLYKRVDVKYTQGQKAQNSFIPAIPARFTQYEEYYLAVDGVSRLDELELNNRKLLKLVPAEKRESLKLHLKENKIKIKDEYSLYQALEYLNKK